MKRISDSTDDSFEDIKQNSEGEEYQDFDGTLSALSRLDTPITAYRRGFVEDLEAKLDKQLSEESDSEDLMDILANIPDDRDYFNE